ncbi:MAG: hypothetical protein V3T30_08940 [Thermodesulfobacteriota bacterium]
MSSEKGLKNKWPWDKEYMRIWLWAPVAIAIAVTIAATQQPDFNISPYWCLMISLTGLPVYIAYGYVGRKMRALKKVLNDKSGEMADSLMVIGMIQSPGMVILNDAELQLIPLVGSPLTIKLADIHAIHEKSSLPGKGLLGKRAFYPEVEGHKKLAFAVCKPVAERFRNKFRVVGI